MTLPAGAYTVQAKAGHWLRGEGMALTSVPWVFAAPTGADKVTVYWDEVPGATGYRVRWGTASGVYPNASGVLPADACRFTVEGLVSDQEYYFVVEAEYNGVWSAPSEEDSATPHVGAIPWDSGDAASILQAVRAVIGNVPQGQLDVLAPDGRYYTEDSFGNPVVTAPPGIYHSETSSINYQGLEIPLTRTRTEALENTRTGPYRRVRTDNDTRCVGAVARFYLPPRIDPIRGVSHIYVNDAYRAPNRELTVDTPCIYFGLAFPKGDVEGGVMFHPAGRGGNPPVSYARWQPYLALFAGIRKTLPVAGGDPYNPKHHIPDDGWNGLFGYYLDLILMPVGFPFGKLTLLGISAYDVFFEDVFFTHIYIGFAPAVPAEGEGVRVRRVHSIAQMQEAVGNIGGYARSGSFIKNVGVDYEPLFYGVPLDLPAHVLRYQNGRYSWQQWTRSGLSEQSGSAGVFPLLRQRPIFSTVTIAMFRFRPTGGICTTFLNRHGLVN
ncbi:MAG: hypothetical protein KatS3mg023_0044 [Armatimonadota bacterium]|nr:MAG: hypothetical protein KatS3mg023_0044 [Armatimonadota bacterium]